MKPAVFLLLCFLLALPKGFAATGATLSGRVTDASGAVVAGAEVEIVNTATNAVIKVVTNSQGLFVAPQIPAGVYNITIKQSGFQTVVKRNIVLNVGDKATENFTLAPGSVQEAVTVSGRSSLIERDSPAVATVVDRQFVENLPLNGRSFL
ncbi:MAG TPA: carboxypeptidase-like regulatory domain-containing protein, partial [Blastocatellia bacterium]|nr:carboxypeptidase-like regulatory domain-containing protein [Blastocatellia bacterium]